MKINRRPKAEVVSSAYDDSRVDYAAYQRAALGTEKPLPEIVGDKEVLVGALKVCIATSALADLMKKVVIYGKEVDIDEIVEKTRGIERAIDGFDSALFRDLPEDYDGETIAVNPRLLHAFLGLFGEAGELLEPLVGQIDGETIDGVNIAEEVGDCQWYMALGLDEIQTTMAEVLTKNNAKLALRYGGGKFTLEKSEARDKTAERKLLEAGSAAQPAAAPAAPAVRLAPSAARAAGVNTGRPPEDPTVGFVDDGVKPSPDKVVPLDKKSGQAAFARQKQEAASEGGDAGTTFV